MSHTLSTYEKEKIIRILSRKDAHIIRTIDRYKTYNSDGTERGGGAIMTYTLICPDEDICARELADYEWDAIKSMVICRLAVYQVGIAALDTLEYRLSPEHKVKNPLRLPGMCIADDPLNAHDNVQAASESRVESFKRRYEAAGKFKFDKKDKKAN